MRRGWRGGALGVGGLAIVVAGCASHATAPLVTASGGLLSADVISGRLTTSPSIYPDGATPPAPVIVTVTSAKARQVVADLNALTSTPLATMSCPTGFPFITILLRFPHETRTFTEDRNCGHVIDAEPGRPRTWLTDSTQLQSDLRHDLPPGAVDPPPNLLGGTSPAQTQ
jgi:hypothetical protein